MLLHLCPRHLARRRKTDLTCRGRRHRGHLAPCLSRPPSLGPHCKTPLCSCTLPHRQGSPATTPRVRNICSSICGCRSNCCTSPSPELWSPSISSPGTLLIASSPPARCRASTSSSPLSGLTRATSRGPSTVPSTSHHLRSDAGQPNVPPGRTDARRPRQVGHHT